MERYSTMIKMMLGTIKFSRKEYSCDYREYTRKIYIMHGKLNNFKVQLLKFTDPTSHH